MSFAIQEDVVVVPVSPRPGWSAVWSDLRIGEFRLFELDAREWAAARGVTIASVAVAADPLVLVGAQPVAPLGLCRLLLGADPAAAAGSELRVAFAVRVAEEPGGLWVFVARLVVRAAVAGLVPLGTAGALAPGVATDADGALIDGNGLVRGAPSAPQPQPAVVADAGGELRDAGGPVTI